MNRFHTPVQYIDRFCQIQIRRKPLCKKGAPQRVSTHKHKHTHTRRETRECKIALKASKVGEIGLVRSTSKYQCLLASSPVSPCGPFDFFRR